jgi:Fic family protein
MLIINHLFHKPIIDAQLANQITNLSLPSVYKLIKELEELKILEEITGGKRGKLFVFKEYLELFK